MKVYLRDWVDFQAAFLDQNILLGQFCMQECGMRRWGVTKSHFGSCTLMKSESLPSACCTPGRADQHTRIPCTYHFCPTLSHTLLCSCGPCCAPFCCQARFINFFYSNSVHLYPCVHTHHLVPASVFMHLCIPPPFLSVATHRLGCSCPHQYTSSLTWSPSQQL